MIEKVKIKTNIELTCSDSGKERVFEIIKVVFLYAYGFINFAVNFVRIYDECFWGDEVYTIKM